MKKKFYSIHNIITFKIINNINLIHKKISNLEIGYQNLECKKKEKPDFGKYYRYKINLPMQYSISISEQPNQLIEDFK